MAGEVIRFKRILCPVDFSSASLRAFDLALQYASQEGAKVHVLHVIPRIVATLMDIPITTSKWTAAQEEKADRELLKLRNRALKLGIDVKTEVRVGDIDFQILKAVNQGAFDLVAMGTHGRRGFERWALGSVAERILRHSKIPILFTASSGKGSASRKVRKILVPCDFSPGTGEAIRASVEIAAQAGAAISLIHVIQDRSAAVDWTSSPDQTAAIRRRLDELMRPQAGLVKKIEARVESGEPYRVILKAIESWKPSLVVLNTHGFGFVHRILVGSTADRIIRGGAALCPMLVIPPRDSPRRR